MSTDECAVQDVATSTREGDTSSLPSHSVPPLTMQLTGDQAEGPVSDQFFQDTQMEDCAVQQVVQH